MLVPNVFGQSGTAIPASALVTKPPAKSSGAVAMTAANAIPAEFPAIGDADRGTSLATTPEIPPSAAPRTKKPSVIHRAFGTADPASGLPSLAGATSFDPRISSPTRDETKPPSEVAPSEGAPSNLAAITSETSQAPRTIGSATCSERWIHGRWVMYQVSHSGPEAVKPIQTADARTRGRSDSDGARAMMRAPSACS